MTHRLTEAEKHALDRVKGLLFLRLAAVLVSLAVIVVSQAGRGAFQVDLYPTYLLLVFVCLANLGYLLLVKRVRNVRRFAAVQIYLDLAFATGLIYLSGAGDSSITFLYFACILSASTILGLGPGILTASTATVILAGMKTLSSLSSQYGWTLPLVNPPQASAALVGFYGDVAGLMAQAVAYHLVAVLAGKLAHGLTSARALNEKILESITDGMLAIDGDRRVRSANRQAVRLLGVPVNYPVVGRTLEEVVASSMNREVLTDVFKGERPGISQVQLVQDDDRVAPVAVTSSALRDERGRRLGVLVTLIDLTERKRLEEALKRAETMEMMGQLAASIAHEIRNPLACIRGSAQEIRSEIRDAQSGKLLDLVVSESDRINSIVTDFLNFSRMRPTALMRCNVTTVLSDVATMLRSRCDRRVSIEFDASRPVFCLGDVEQLRQVFLNLGLNAIEAMPGGGRLRVRVRHEEPAWSLDGLGRGGRDVVVEFIDEGEGMTPEVRHQLFSPFFSTKSRGTGLGLCVVRKIVEAHKGLVEVESTPGSGSTFRVTLEGYQASELQVSHV